MKKIILLMYMFIFLFLFSLSFASAIKIQSIAPSIYMNRTVNTLINITINNTEAFNVTQIVVTFPLESRFFADSNGTDASNVVFSNTTGGAPPSIQLVWTNTTSAGFIQNNSQTKSFWFNASLTRAGSNAFFTQFTILTNGTNNVGNSTSYLYTVNFEFAGFIVNESGSFQNGTNISIYQFVEGSGGPPTTILEAQTQSNGSGYFSFQGLNGSASLYQLQIIHYNASNLATKIGSILPPFPANMYYPMTVDRQEFSFMIPPSLNGTTFYLQPAATLRLYAHNNSNIQQKFGYEVVDQKVGFPLDSNFMASVTTKDIVVPIGRNYTVMFVRTPGFLGGSSGFSFSPLCDGKFMNDTLCPAPPISNSSLGELSAGQILTINQSLIINNYRLTGCINATPNNNTAINITKISLKMVPWAGFVPPIKADRGDINLTADINYTGKGGCNFAFYNISVMGSTGGLQYLFEIFAKNASNDAGNPGANAWNLAVFQNLTITGETNFNLTLTRLIGSYIANDSTTNTSYIRINIQNSTGGVITNNMNAFVKVKNPAFGTMNYIIESLSSGTFYMPILNNTNWVKVTVFASDSPPKEININLSTSETNITLITMTDGRGIGMKRINSTGGVELVSNDLLNTTSPLNMRFLRNSDSCNVLDPGSSCVITNSTAKNFNPLSALVAGKINMEMKISSTNVTLSFINFDMFSAKQPPLESVINSNASSASSADQVWQFGSFAPSDSYDYAVISMPYSDSASSNSYFNDVADNINLSIPLLYDENWKVVFNKTRGDTSANLTDDFIDYNSSALYRNYLSSAGASCSKTDPNLNVTPCFINTSANMVYMKVPHFSGVGPNVAGNSNPSAAASSSSSSSSSSDGGGSRSIIAPLNKTATPSGSGEEVAGGEKTGGAGEEGLSPENISGKFNKSAISTIILIVSALVIFVMIGVIIIKRHKGR